jgi:hypothetical protein
MSKQFQTRIFIFIMLSSCVVKNANGQRIIRIKDFSSFKPSGKTWQTAADVTADLNKPNTFNIVKGAGVLVNLPDKDDHGIDLFTTADYGDIDLELDYMMASGSNSGIYLQGRYEIQLEDTWGSNTTASGKNGGIYEQWDDTRPEGKKGYGGFAPRQNASRAPGLWQHIKISFLAPRFDADGKKLEGAKMLGVELNGVLIHENVELPGPTRGGLPGEKAVGPLRIQGDHGAVAFRNIQITTFDGARAKQIEPVRPNAVYPIFVQASTHPVFRSFMDLPGGLRVVHAISVGSEEKVHYTYDTDTGMLLQAWRGGFLDATPMWHSRGDGSARAVGMLQRFGNPAPALVKLSSAQTSWKSDSADTHFRPKGYSLDVNDKPTFKYTTYGVAVSDAITPIPGGQGISREVTIQKAVPGLYFRLAEAAAITEVANGMYLVDDHAYYLRIEDAAGQKPVLRNSNGRQELLIPLVSKVKYSILF